MTPKASPTQATCPLLYLAAAALLRTKCVVLFRGLGDAEPVPSCGHSWWELRLRLPSRPNGSTAGPREGSVAWSWATSLCRGPCISAVPTGNWGCSWGDAPPHGTDSSSAVCAWRDQSPQVLRSKKELRVLSFGWAVGF